MSTYELTFLSSSCDNLRFGPTLDNLSVSYSAGRPLHRDDRPIPRKGRPLISPIGMNLILLAAGPGFARIPFYTGFTKKGFLAKINVFNKFKVLI